MPTPNVFVGHIAGDILPAADWDTNFILAETSLLDHGSYVVSGLVPSIGTGLSVNVTAGHAIIGADINFAAGFVIGSLTDATTNHLYVLQNSTGTFNVSGIPPANSTKIGTCTTAGGVVTAVQTGRLSGRQQFLQPQALIPGGPAAGLTSAGHPAGVNFANWNLTDAEGKSCYGVLPAGAVTSASLPADVAYTDAANVFTLNNTFSHAPTASANSAVLQLGDGGFAGGGTNFIGSANGTYLGVNAAAAATARLIELQVGGVSKLFMGVGGVLTLANKIATPGLQTGQRTATGNTVLTTLDYTVFCDPTGGSFTVTLPTAASGAGQVYAVVKKVASANTVTLQGNGAELIQTAPGTSANTLVVTNHVMVQSDGTTWYLLA